MNIPIELKTRTYDHIGKVQQHLGEFEADEQREILESIETHIHDALETRSAGKPTMALLDAIIAEMDPPESYGSATPLFDPASSTSIMPGRKLWFFGVIATLCFLFIAIWLADPFSSHWMNRCIKPEAAAQKNLIQEGVGWNSFAIGMSREALLQQHGAIQPDLPHWLMRWDANPFIDVVITDEGICKEVRFNRGFAGETAGGITPGSAFQEAGVAYGTPELVWTKDSCVIAEWPSKGIALWTSGAEVTQIIVRQPRTKSSPPFTDDPRVIGHWKSIDFVEHIDQFDPASPSWNGDLSLKELTFLSNGRSPNAWKWTSGFVQQQNTLSRYHFKQIGDETYLFLEWMSGDVTKRGASPRYYVFTKE